MIHFFIVNVKILHNVVVSRERYRSTYKLQNWASKLMFHKQTTNFTTTLKNTWFSLKGSQIISSLYMSKPWTTEYVFYFYGPGLNHNFGVNSRKAVIVGYTFSSSQVSYQYTTPWKLWIMDFRWTELNNRVYLLKGFVARSWFKSFTASPLWKRVAN